MLELNIEFSDGDVLNFDNYCLQLNGKKKIYVKTYFKKTLPI